MTRKVSIPFIVGDKTIKRLKDLKEVLQNNPAELVPAIEDGRLKRFLRGYGPKFEQLFQQYTDPKELLQALANLLNIELGEFKKIPQYIKSSDELVEKLSKSDKNFLGKGILKKIQNTLRSSTDQKEILLGKGIFDIEKLILDKPVILKGVGRNETLIRTKLIVIANPDIELERLTVEADTIVFLQPIKKLINTSFVAKSNSTFSEKQIITIENSEFKVGNEAWEVPFDKLFEIQTNSNKPIEIWTKNSFKKEKKLVENKIILVKEDIVLENVQVIIKNCKVLFEKNTGLALKDGTFIAENSKFLPKNGEWKNVALIGNIKGHIKGCLFAGGTGRKGKFYNNLGRRNFGSEELNDELGEWYFESEDKYGGCLFVYSTDGEFLIKETTFNNCSAKEYGGGVYAYYHTRIIDCGFNNCSANCGSEFIDDFADCGGGIYRVSYTNTLLNNSFKNCKPNNKN